MTKHLRTFAVALLLSTIVFTYAVAQDPYTLSPTIGGNTSITNGAGSGYSPSFTASTLTLSLSPGATFCGTTGAVVTYAGGTLTMVNGINYVYLDPTASCAPTSSTIPFIIGQVPIAIVTASGGQITGVRTPGTTKQDAAVTDIGTGPGVVIDVPGMGSGLVTSLPNNVALLDFRQTQDILNGSNVAMVRTPIIGITQNLGDLTSVALTGTVTLTSGMTGVTGTNTHFLTEINPANSFGVSVKASADASTCWTLVASVADDTHATLSTAYPTIGCSGVGGGTAQKFITQLGLAVTSLATAGTPNTPGGGESVGLSVFSSRTGGRRPLFGANINTSFQTVPASNVITDSTTASAMEVDFSNSSPSDVIFPWIPLNSALHILSAGSKKAGSGISIYRSQNGVNEFGAGIWINQAWDTTNASGAGVLLEGGKSHIALVPLTVDGNHQIRGTDGSRTSDIWWVTNSGIGQFSEGQGAGAIQYNVTAANRTGLAGVASFGLNVANTNETAAYKAGLGLLRQASNGAGTLCLYNRIATDSGVSFGSGDAAICSTYLGAINLTAQGTSQNITLTPSGTTGSILLGPIIGTQQGPVIVPGNLNNVAPAGLSQGLGIGWNFTGANGEVDFISDKTSSGTTGGFNFYDWNGTTMTLLATLSKTGRLTVTQGITAGLRSVTFSAMPTFDPSLGNTQTITLTANVTSSTLSNCTAGQSLTFDIIQNATGGFTFVWPTNVLNAGTIGATASKHNIQAFYCDGTNARATAAMLTNQN